MLGGLDLWRFGFRFGDWGFGFGVRGLGLGGLGLVVNPKSPKP